MSPAKQNAAQISHRLFRDLLCSDAVFERQRRLAREPRRLRRPIAHKRDPTERPQNRRQSLHDEGLLPAQLVDKISRNRRHPKNRDGVGQHQQRVGTRALGPRKPAREQVQHDREDQTLSDPEQKSVEREQPEGSHHTRERSEDAPGHQRPKDYAADAIFSCQDGARNLEREVSQEEQAGEQRRFLATDVQRGSQTRGNTESEVGAVHVRQAIGDEDRRHQIEPALLRIRRNLLLDRLPDRLQFVHRVLGAHPVGSGFGFLGPGGRR